MRLARGPGSIALAPGRYDAFLYIDETEALHPLHMAAKVDYEAPETYPSGV